MRASAVVLIALLAGCAHRPPTRTGAAPPPRILVDTLRADLPAPAPGSAPTERSQRVAAAHDTAYVSGVLRRCGTRTLLPDQESIRETLLRMLAEARVALTDGDLERARSTARNARQLATSLRCP